ELPRRTHLTEAGDVLFEFSREREPFTTLADIRELAVPAPFDDPITALEREKLLMPDAGESLARSPTGTDLHAAVVAQIVDDVDAREGKVGIRHIPVAPGAIGARPSTVEAFPTGAATEVTWTGEVFGFRHALNDTRGCRHR